MDEEVTIEKERMEVMRFVVEGVIDWVTAFSTAPSFLVIDFDIKGVDVIKFNIFDCVCDILSGVVAVGNMTSVSVDMTYAIGILVIGLLETIMLELVTVAVFSIALGPKTRQKLHYIIVTSPL